MRLGSIFLRILDGLVNIPKHFLKKNDFMTLHNSNITYRSLKSLFGVKRKINSKSASEDNLSQNQNRSSTFEIFLLDSIY